MVETDEERAGTEGLAVIGMVAVAVVSLVRSFAENCDNCSSSSSCHSNDKCLFLSVQNYGKCGAGRRRRGIGSKSGGSC